MVAHRVAAEEQLVAVAVEVARSYRIDNEVKERPIGAEIRAGYDVAQPRTEARLLGVARQQRRDLTGQLRDRCGKDLNGECHPLRLAACQPTVKHAF